MVDEDGQSQLFGLVKQAGFTEDSFKACLTNQQILDGVNAVKDRASKELGVDATPMARALSGQGH